MLSEVKQVTLVIEKDVSFVGFRNYIEGLAQKYQLPRFVYNDYQEGNVKFICEGGVQDIEKMRDEIEGYPGVKRVTSSEKIQLPKPAGRVVSGIERDIFERLDLGVTHLGAIEGHTGKMDSRMESMDNHLESINTSLEENISMLKENTETSRENTTILRDIRGILKSLAEK